MTSVNWNQTWHQGPNSYSPHQNGSLVHPALLPTQKPNGGGLYQAMARRVIFQAEQLDRLRARYEVMFGSTELTTMVFSHRGRTYHFCGFAGEIEPRQGGLGVLPSNFSSPQYSTQLLNPYASQLKPAPPAHNFYTSAQAPQTREVDILPKGSFHESFVPGPDAYHGHHVATSAFNQANPKHTSAFSPMGGTRQSNLAIRKHQTLSPPHIRKAKTPPLQNPSKPSPDAPLATGMAKKDPPMERANHVVDGHDPERDAPSTSDSDVKLKGTETPKAIKDLDNDMDMTSIDPKHDDLSTEHAKPKVEDTEAVKYRVCPLKNTLPDSTPRHKPYEYERK